MGTCDNCKYWEEKKANNDKVVQGFCHFNPPAGTGCFVPKVNKFSGEVVPQLMEMTVWALTNAVSWCGKFEEKVKPLIAPDNLTEPIPTQR